MKCKVCDNQGQYEITYNVYLGISGKEELFKTSYYLCEQHFPLINTDITNKIIQYRKENSNETTD